MIRKYLLGSDSTDTFIRIVVILSLLFSGVASFEAAKTAQHQGRLAACVADWANRYTDVATRRANANTSRLDALNHLLVDSIADPHQAQQGGDLEALLRDMYLGLDFKVHAKKYLDDIAVANVDPKITQDVNDYIKSEHDYATEVARDPIPDPPKEVC